MDWCEIVSSDTKEKEKGSVGHVSCSKEDSKNIVKIRRRDINEGNGLEVGMKKEVRGGNWKKITRTKYGIKGH